MRGVDARVMGAHAAWTLCSNYFSMLERPTGWVTLHHVYGCLPVRLPVVVAVRGRSPGFVCHRRPVIFVEARVIFQTLRRDIHMEALLCRIES